ncbi:hypothetical protein KUV61_06495 [Nocardioides marinus]|nr:hypothetical protein [Nocardioides marinus]
MVMLKAVFQSQLSLRLIVASLVISSILSVFSTGVQLYLSYESQKRDAAAGLQLIRETVSTSLARGLWEFNQDIVQTILEGVLTSDFIDGVALNTPTGNSWELGRKQPDQYDEDIPLTYTLSTAESFPVGTLKVSLDYSRIQQRIWSQLWTTLASNIAKAYFAALALLLVFYTLVSRHLVRVAAHIDASDSEETPRKLTLDRTPPATPDELDTLVAAFNDYEARIARQMDALNNEIRDRRRAEKERDALSIHSAFLTTVSHEIRTPLNAILGLMHLIELAPDNPPKTRQHARTALAAGQNLLEMLNNTLEAARLEAKEVKVNPVKTNIRDLAAYWLETTRAAVHRRGKSDKVEATLHVADDLAQYYLLDGARLSQVVGNLTDNAAKFTNEGEIRISVELEEAPNGASPLQLQVKVRDTGGGIEKNAQKMIFDRFRQVDQGLKRQHDGAGLGLAISSEIAELMGGSLELTEVPRDGFATEFLFLIPTEAITEPADE